MLNIYYCYQLAGIIRQDLDVKNTRDGVELRRLFVGVVLELVIHVIKVLNMYKPKDFVC